MRGLLKAGRRDWRKRTWYGRFCYPFDALQWLIFFTIAVPFLLASLYMKAIRGEPPFDFDSPPKYKECDDS